MKKLILVTSVFALAAGAFAGPCGPARGCGRPGWGCGPRPHCPPPCHRSGDFWGRGGRNFWPGFVGGLVGGVVASSVVETRPVVVSQPVVTTPVVTTPVVVSQPVVVTQPATTVQSVWVEGRYVDQVQANGTVVRVWNPGHYETR